MTGDQLIGLEPYVRTVTSTLLHSLWQGTLIGLLAAVVLSLLRSGNARIRYAVSCGAMAAVIVAATVTAVSVWPDRHESAGHVSQVAADLVRTGDNSDGGATTGVPALTDGVPSASHWWQDPSISRYIFTIWVAGVMLLSVYHIIGWRRARRLVKRGTSTVSAEWQVRFERLCHDLGIRRFVRLLRSSVVKVPCVIGWMKPVILVPLSMFTSLDPSEIEMILVHELAHVRRYDVLVSILEAAMETLFFFNPAIWWLSRQVRIERENCCDDTAIVRTGSGLPYARALVNLEELRMFQTSYGAALTGMPLKRRIQRIVGATRPRSHASVAGISGTLLAASLIVVALGSLGGSHDSLVRAGEATAAAQASDPAPGDLRGEWETKWDRHELKILVYGRASDGMSFVLSRKDVADLLNQGKTSFEIIRDAGTVLLEGKLEERGREVAGRGTWRFRPDSGYMQFMGGYGLPEDDAQKTFSLAIFDVSREFISDLEEYGCRDLTVDQLLSARVQGISSEYVEEFHKAGYSDLSYNDLLSMAVQGVTPNDAREFEESGVGHLTASQLISARIQGITPEYIESFREAGFRDLTFSNFTTLYAFSVDAEDFADCYRHRFMDLSEQNMVWVCGFGFTRRDIDRMQERGYTDIDTIIRLLAEEAGR